MEFDKSRAFTAVNADELRAGDKVICANCMTDLKKFVQKETETEKLVCVLSENDNDRFYIGDNVSYNLAYLVERAENCTNCGEGKWDAEHKKILCDPAHCGNGNVVFRNQETEVCEYWKPKTKQKAEKDCDNCGQRCDGYGKGEVCSQWKLKTEQKHTDCNHCPREMICEDAFSVSSCNKHYRPFKDTDELFKVWNKKLGYTGPTGSKFTMPYIWVKLKICESGGLLLTGYDKVNGIVNVDGIGYNLKYLFDEYTFLDGSPCGVEE